MKIKNLLQAPLILEELKRLNIDVNTLDPQTRVKLVDGCLVFEPGKECFVSSESIEIIEPSGNSEPLGYYYLKHGDIIEERDEYIELYADPQKWNPTECAGETYNCLIHNQLRRKIQKNPTS